MSPSYGGWEYFNEQLQHRLHLSDMRLRRVHQMLHDLARRVGVDPMELELGVPKETEKEQVNGKGQEQTEQRQDGEVSAHEEEGQEEG